MSETDALGQALRTWRERLSPSSVGMVAGRDRRTPGLRREELAALADVSVDYVVRLEQGRARPSVPVLGALTRALLLSKDERDHLFRLAGHEPPTDAAISHYIPVGVQRMLVRLGDVAIAVFSADWTLISWSPLWAAVMGVPDGPEIDQTNLARMTFLPGDRPIGFGAHPIRTMGDSKQDRANLVADLRWATGKYPRDAELAALIDDLLGNTEFAQTWHSGVVARHGSIRKLVSHPLGEIILDCDTLTVPGADLNILVYTAAEGSPDAELLEFLRITRPTTIADRRTR
ncbi:helix-turn-helix domain-containing protein [Curtobacterium pusillum]|uniref:helix-turn-helix domain-containing protein n=1 Tax=Curtobacterium pusillum TaxID=69373 RepID=UPI0011A17073|nr:helix-turn-helix transcriptional regulator [Curtobacterium pusillum]